MRYALLSDIHANWEALEKAGKDLALRRIDKIAVLGDTIGYGANPNECLDWALEKADIYLMGNHEKAIFDEALRDVFNPMAAEAITWTASVLKKNLSEKLPDLEYAKIENHLMFTHGSPDRPEDFRYLMNYEDARESFSVMTETVCFVGHTHVPCAICEGKRRTEYLHAGIIKIESGVRTILNPGSVGQPRDRDPRLSYGIYDDKERTFEIIRLEYDNQKAARKIIAAGLPEYLGERLL